MASVSDIWICSSNQYRHAPRLGYWCSATHVIHPAAAGGEWNIMKTWGDGKVKPGGAGSMRFTRRD